MIPDCVLETQLFGQGNGETIARPSAVVDFVKQLKLYLALR
jgi:hypothetical protein